MTGIKPKMIAPCGMNCAICSGHLREKKQCPGCNYQSDDIPGYCRKCIIRNCDVITRRKSKKFCFVCKDYPCKRLKALDKRYKGKYRMSMIENLEFIQERGIRDFVRQEKERWKCPECGGIIDVHHKYCYNCKAKDERKDTHLSSK